MLVNIKKLNENAKLPTYGTVYSAGCDLYACMDEDISINPGETKLIKTYEYQSQSLVPYRLATPLQMG